VAAEKKLFERFDEIGFFGFGRGGFQTRPYGDPRHNQFVGMFFAIAV
jgi:hypothetical protein